MIYHASAFHDAARQMPAGAAKAIETLMNINTGMGFAAEAGYRCWAVALVRASVQPRNHYARIICCRTSWEVSRKKERN